MSMNGQFRSISPHALEILHRQPALMFEAVTTTPSEGDELSAAGITQADLGNLLDIGKDWHALHYLLTGTPWETGPGVAHTVLGGVETGEDTGYGSPRLLTAAETAEVAAALAALDEAQVMARYDPDAMNDADIYPGSDDYDDEREELADTFRVVRDYYATARDRGFGMILAIV